MLTNRDNFQLKKTIGSSWITDQDDVVKTKSALEKTGDYKAPDWGINGISDEDMFDGLKSFQKREGLEVDGVMKPGGPTEERLRQTTQKARSAKSLTASHQPQKETPKAASGIAEGEWDKNHPWMPAGQKRSEPIVGGLPNGRGIERPSKQQIGHIPRLDDQRFGDRHQQSERDRSQDIEVAMALLIPAGAELLKRYGPQALRGLENVLRSMPPLLGAAEQAKKRSGQSENDNESYPPPIPQPSKDDISKAKRANIDRADPLPPMPGFESPNDPLPDRTESPSKLVELPELPSSLPDTEEPTIFVLPIPDMKEFGDGILERKGNEATRKELERIRDYFLSLGWKHVAGGRYAADDPLVMNGTDQKIEAGAERSEWHIPGPGKAFEADSRPGGHFTDLTFEDNRGRIVHVQSVDVDRNGKPTRRELENAERIRRAEKGTDVLLIPKGWQLKSNQRF
ncbi:peptidoglycan-binding protein [Rhodospirillales bacterium]|nr:peptidoglycan-binding protein [Rhodospirillales bacterium]